jgi:hypothetical protein
MFITWIFWMVCVPAIAFWGSNATAIQVKAVYSFWPFIGQSLIYGIVFYISFNWMKKH